MINWLSNLINRNRSAAKISQVLCSTGHTTPLFEGNLYTMIKLEREGSFSQNNNDKKKLCARRILEKLICNCFPNVNDRDTTLKYRLIKIILGRQLNYTT